MRYLFNLVLYFGIFALASCNRAPWSYNIGDELVLVHTPPQFKTVADNTMCKRWLIGIERGVTPAISETVIVQEGAFEVVVTPIKYNKDGSIKTVAKVRIRSIPSVTKQVTYPALKIPSEEEQRKVSAKCKPIIRRVIWTPATYKIKDKAGATIKDFETAQAVAEYINSKLAY